MAKNNKTKKKTENQEKKETSEKPEGGGKRSGGGKPHGNPGKPGKNAGKTTKAKSDRKVMELPAPSPPPSDAQGKDEGEGGGRKLPFPIVAMGASAGGLEALESFFSHMPPDGGMAFVIIQHLDPKRKSMMDELLRRYTTMKIFIVRDGMKVEPNTVYLNPADKYVCIF